MAKKKPNSKRKKPCQQRYTSERRWIKNKRKKAQKNANNRHQVVKVKIDGEWETFNPKFKKEKKED